MLGSTMLLTFTNSSGRDLATSHSPPPPSNRQSHGVLFDSNLSRSVDVNIEGEYLHTLQYSSRL